MANAEKRTLTIEARLRNYLKGDLSATKRIIGDFALTAVQGFGKLKNSLFNVRNAVLGVAAAFGAYRVLDFVKQTGEQADALSKLAASTGDVIENLSELQAAFGLAGIDQGSFATNLRALLKAQREAATGNEEFLRSFADLGITFEELQRLAPSQLYEQLAAGLEQFGTAQEKAIALGKILPKQFLDLLPVLSKGSQAFKQSILEVRELGATVTNEQGLIAEKVNDSFTKLAIAARAAGRELIVAFGPQVTAGMESIAGLVAQNRDAIVEFAKAIGSAVVLAVSVAIDAFIELVDYIEEIPGIKLVGSDEQARLEELLVIAQKFRSDLPQQFALQGGGFDLAAAIKEADVAILDLQTSIEKLEPSTVLRALKQRITEEAAAGASKIRLEFNPSAGQAVTASDVKQNGIPILGVPNLDEINLYASEVKGSLASVFRDTGGVRSALPDGEDAPTKSLFSERDRLAAQQQLAQITGNEQALARLDQQAKRMDLRDLFDEGKISAYEFAFALAEIEGKVVSLGAEVNRDDFFGGFSAGAGKAIDEWTDFTAAGEAAGQSIVSGGLDGISNALTDVVMGTKSAKEAFRGFALAILRDIAQVIIRLTIMRALGFSGGGFETGGVGPGVTGTAPVREFATGGVVRRPTMALFGEGRTAEAFVPLPDNRSIPVSFVGGGNQGSQVTINISAMDSRDVRRALMEQQGTLRTIFTNQLDTKSQMRSSIQRAAR
jgi:hypothetical protein